MKIGVVVVHFGPLSLTQACLKSFVGKIDSPTVVIVNNSSLDPRPLTSLFPGTLVVDNRENVGFARAANQGITAALAASGVTHVLVLNNDAKLVSGQLAGLLATFAKHPRVGLVAPVLHHAGGYDWGGKYRPWSGMVKHTNWPNRPKTVLSVTHVAGAAMLIPRQVVDEIGLFDERYFAYYEDLDYCLRVLAAGYFIRLNPEVVVEHTVSASSTLPTRVLWQWRSHLQFVAKHLPRTALPSAILWDLFFYPLALLKSLLIK